MGSTKKDDGFGSPVFDGTDHKHDWRADVVRQQRNARSKQPTLQRRLRSRHLQMIAIGISPFFLLISNDI